MSAMNVLLTPHFYDNPWYVPLGLPSNNNGLWDSRATMTKDEAWNVLKQTPPVTNAPPINMEPPSAVFHSDDWDDDVSLLNDDPDEDDIQILPQTTYNVLAPLFAEIYKDDSELDDDDEDDDDRELADGAKAA
jgi:hypothetical protein